MQKATSSVHTKFMCEKSKDWQIEGQFGKITREKYSICYKIYLDFL